ncbi:hypothetical protein Glove_86g90 [Diversispora epigaea]|uniref:Protein kinase domain-containing protein n=1 Tax=Diversispora epigaea TaxID=1348612 RepID=A0A397JGA2_9GLOM|nr:hypothetical protein Glove_86g90 [Diversispora epigaea]
MLLETFPKDFNNWTSGNDKIDKFIQDAQLNANDNLQVIEWIPYIKFKDVKRIGKGGFGTVDYARWIDGYIIKWDIENQQWKRQRNWGGRSRRSRSGIEKMEIHLKIYAKYDAIRFYGITQDPETRLYVMISDFGLSKLIGVNPNNHEKKNIFGVLPYIAPEVLSDDEEYTKAADVYSFGIIAYEIVTGFPPYPDIPHDKDLAMKICNGLRPKIPFHTPKLITRMVMRDYLKEGKNKDSEIGIQIKKADEFSANQELTNTITATTTTPLNYQTHPQAIYTSRLLNFSKLSKPKNEENFEKELEELTKYMSNLCPNNSDLFI